MRAVMRYIENNILLRNAAIVILISSVVIFQEITLGKFKWTDSVYAITGNMILVATCAYHNRFLYERYLRVKKYGLYMLLLLAGFAVSQLLYVIQEYLLLGYAFPQHTVAVWLSVFFINILIWAIGFCMYFSYTHYKEKHEALNLEYLKREIELSQLKHRLNPHFLFNALNNIYRYSRGQHEHSGELIMKLSELMRMVLENSSRDNVTIREEMYFTEHYLAFEKERLGGHCQIQFVQNIDNEDIPIPPFLFFPLLDNAFRHGVSPGRETFVDILLTAHSNMMSFRIINTIQHNDTPQMGMGLQNIRRRLELLYPGRHRLDISAEDGMYAVALVIF